MISLPKMLSRTRFFQKSSLSHAVRPLATSFSKRCIAPQTYERLFTSAATAAVDYNPPTQIAALTERDNRVSVLWADGQEGDFHFAWLRDNDPLRFMSCGQKMPIESIIPGSKSLIPTSLETDDENETLRIRWGNQDQDSIFTSSWLRMHCYDKMDLDLTATRASRALSYHQPPEIDFDTLFENNEGVYKWLKMVNEFGLALVKNVPSNDGEVLNVSGLVGKSSHTMYGENFDVKTEANPINAAFSDAALEFHMDLAYFESPPGLQYLHALRFDTSMEGGESTFIDAHAVAEVFKEREPEAFETLVRVPATFQKNHVDRANPARLFYQRPHISVNYVNEVIAVFWAPPFEGPLMVLSEDVETYYAAYAKFRALMNSDEMMKRYGYRFRLQTGDLICFNNRRMLHGRDAFRSHQGVRHLQGCYNTIDDFLNKYRVLAFEYDPHPNVLLGGGIAAYGEERVGTTSHR
uniref:TauD/TfdA-like domain-containing protein n=1 Tax=Aplanochytrium stocchinoi TaxID=215587 RepID=A0A7S3UXS5_9STRA|mmetsp:Transcript_12936/g.14979  ORF Transcript_12936/g.14979 Transcript_12936/m.14979 type:complete len:465 (-) Transcript_12936:889-2283(-)